MSKDYQSDLIRMQHQVRNNAQEYQDYLSDLQRWTKDISNKDKKLQESEKKKTNYPPIRGTTTNEEEEIDVEEEADKLKEKGNEFFKKGDMEKAIECYSQSLQYKQDHIVYSNRSQALFKLKKFKEAELDATKSISLSSNYIKSYMRRGMARRELQKFKESKEDFEFAYKLSPTHVETKRELDKSIELLKKSEEGKASRIDIEEVVEEEEKPTKVKKEEVKPTPVVKEQKTVEPTKIEPKKIEKEEEIEELVTEAASKLKKTEVIAKEIPKQQEVKKEEPHKKEEPKKETVKPTIIKEKEKTKEEFITAKINVKVNVPTVPPSSFFEFEKCFQELKDENFFDYLKIIPTNRYKKLFQDSLTPELFNAMLNCIVTYFLAKPYNLELVRHSYEMLKALSEVNRFDMIVMFLESKEEAMVKSIFNILNETIGNEYDIKKLESSFH
ncbi:hypothetical protein ABK040_009759 [Willaertia magna]